MKALLAVWLLISGYLIPAVIAVTIVVSWLPTDALGQGRTTITTLLIFMVLRWAINLPVRIAVEIKK